MRHLIAIAFLVLALAAHTESLSDLPPPLPQSYVSDRHNLLAADTRAELDRLAATLDRSDRGQLGVAVIHTTGGADHRRFATDLFNRWGVGDRRRNDGLLILLALDDRAAEIILGEGIDNSANRTHAERVMRQQMVPRFREGHYDQAMLAGATDLLAAAYALDLSRPAELPATRDLPATFAGFVEAPVAVDRSAAGAAANDPAALASTTFEANAPRAAPAPAPISTQPAPLREFDGETAVGLGILGTLAAAVMWLLNKLVRLIWWVTGFGHRKCSRCNARMSRLDETADDARLSPGELAEEKLRSVDHRVFLCPACGQVDKLSRRAWFTRYSDCKACHSRALSSVSKTLTPATRYSTGLAEVTSTCQHCKDVRVERRVLPVLPPPSSSSSSGSSFGGGRSSGGGASGRW
ncbi:MAG: TPM domain-containing protein [Xanthomonadales bacterium]|nr:hypothetical protein [Xanthomonadales bacterium]MCC6592792.1 TPM domain-containing protein [Xanthomonadales bacterium]MCE7932607.1 TPM domain-containing protein [Xanthomonadales bacterium PRO6]